MQKINNIYGSYIITTTKARIYKRFSKISNKDKSSKIFNNILISLYINNLGRRRV